MPKISFNKIFILFLILLFCCAGVNTHFLYCKFLAKTFSKPVRFIPPGADFIPLKPHLDRLGIKDAGFMTDKVSPNPGTDAQIMYEYQAAQYILLPIKLDYFHAHDHEHIILKCFKEKNLPRILYDLGGESVVQIDPHVFLVRQKK